MCPVQTTGAVTTYSYDGDGHRVTKTTGGNTTLYIYSGAGELAAEYSTQAQTPLCNTCFLAVDHLGSTRMVMDESGAVKARHDYFPWGEELLTASRTGALGYQANDGVSQKFTGKERDAETGLDYFGARYLSAAQGRFTSPDPLPGWRKDPQSWNMYAYGRNNPLRYVDPDGETYRVCDADGKNCGNISDSQFEQYRSDSKGLNFRGGSSGSIYAGNTLSGTFTQTDVDLDPGVAMALHAAGQTADREVKAFVRDVAIAAVTGPLLGETVGAITKGLENVPLLRQVSSAISNNTIKHLVNQGHLAEFQKLIPGISRRGREHRNRRCENGHASFRKGV